MANVDQRAALQRLIEEHKAGYAGLSRLIDKNAAYIQQFVRRGVPRKLDEEDARRLARFFGVSPAELGVEPLRNPEDDLVRVPRYEIGASAGHGSLHDQDLLHSHVAFDPKWLWELCKKTSAPLAFIRVQGDSMAPTLDHGDDILVDESDRVDRLRDGIYVLRRDETLMVKRIAVSPMGRDVTIKSDNPAYPEWPGCDLAELEIIGRVIWAGRKVS